MTKSYFLSSFCHIHKILLFPQDSMHITSSVKIFTVSCQTMNYAFLNEDDRRFPFRNTENIFSVIVSTCLNLCPICSLFSTIFKWEARKKVKYDHDVYRWKLRF